MAYYQNRDEIGDYINLLADKYPKCFFTLPQRRVPLKKDIEDDLSDAKVIGANKLGDVLYYYTNHLAYHYNIKAGTNRVDLDGNPVAKVTEAEEREAQKQIAQINERRNVIKQGLASETRPAPVVVRIPHNLLPSDEAEMFATVDKTMLKARSLRAEDPGLGAELAVTALRRAAATINRLIDRYQSPEPEERNLDK